MKLILVVTNDTDDKSFLVSDDKVHAYGMGDSLAQAIGDWMEMIDEMRSELESGENLAPHLLRKRMILREMVNVPD